MLQLILQQGLAKAWMLEWTQSSNNLQEIVLICSSFTDNGTGNYTKFLLMQMGMNNLILLVILLV